MHNGTDRQITSRVSRQELIILRESSSTIGQKSAGKLQQISGVRVKPCPQFLGFMNYFLQESNSQHLC